MRCTHTTPPSLQTPPDTICIHIHRGLILEPTLTELRARAVVRYAEVHDRTVPYEVSIPEVERRQRRGLLRRS